MTGDLLGTVAQSLVNIVVGLSIAFSNGWQLTLVIMAIMPFLIIAGAIQMKTLHKFGQNTRDAFIESNRIAVEVIENIRTVCCLGKRSDSSSKTLNV